MCSIYQQDPDACLSNETSQDFQCPQFLPVITELGEANFDFDVEDWDQFMKWEASPADVRQGIIRQNSDSTTCSNSSLDPYFENSSDQIAINEHPSSLFSNVSDLEPSRDSHDAGNHMSPSRRYRGYSSLTAAQVQELENIAMPYGIAAWDDPRQSQSPTTSSPESQFSKTTNLVHKRKHCSKKEQGVGAEDTTFGQLRKDGHNAIEKRYRANLNEKIYLLGQSIPSLMTAHTVAMDDTEGSTRVSPDREKYSKAAIITRATEYITYLEDKNKKVALKAISLSKRVEAFEKLALSGSFDMNNTSPAEATKTEVLDSLKDEFQQSSLFEAADEDDAEQMRSKRRYSKSQSD